MARMVIGEADYVAGDAVVVHADGSTSPLDQGDVIFFNDTINTGADGVVRVVFLDGSGLNVGAASSAVLDTSIFDPVSRGFTLAEAGLTEVMRGNDRLTDQIAEVTAADGGVRVTRANGSVADLVQGDLLYPNDVIRVGESGSARLAMLDGSTMTFGPDSYVQLDDAIFPSQYPDYISSGASDAVAIHEAILAGQDPSEASATPAAGLEEDGDGSNIVVLKAVREHLTPEHGHETHGFERPFEVMDEELLQGFGNSIPALLVIQDGDGSVDEAALPGGSDPDSPNETTTGRFTVDTGGDNLQSLVIDGVDVTNGGTIAGQFGILTVTEDNGNYSWSYTLTDSTAHGDPTSTGTPEGIQEDFTVVATDGDGDSSPAAILSVAINDDGPQAVADQTSTVEETPVSFNVITNPNGTSDSAGADSPTTLTQATLVSGSGTLDGFTPDGDVTVTPAPGFTGELVVDYTITDADGDSSSATLTVTVEADTGPTVLVVQGGDGGVNEAALPNGSNPGSGNDTTSGTFVVDPGNGLQNLIIGGVDVTNGGTVTGQFGTLTVTEDNGNYSWSYTLTDSATHGDPNSTGTPEGIQEDFTIVATDTDGDASPAATLSVAINDDGPSINDLDVGNIDEGSGPHDLGSAASVLGIDPGADGLGSVVIDTVQDSGGTLEIIAGQLVYTPPENVDDTNGAIGETFTVTVTDAEGDTAISTVTVGVVGPTLIIGSNADDTGDDDGNDPHTINETPATSGDIRGTESADLLVGDTGGARITETNANIILVLDTSGSMSNSIEFTDSNGNTSTISRLEALKLSINSLLEEMAASDATEVRVHIVRFNAEGHDLGTFDLKGGGLQDALDAIDSLVARGWTNYEAGLQEAIDWSGDPANLLADGNVINQTFFVSDGNPTAFTKEDGTPARRVSAPTAMSQALGTDSSGSEQDDTNEVAILESQFGPTEAIGIALRTQSRIDNLDQIEGESRDADVADNITTANELSDVLSDLNPVRDLSALGDDSIDGGGGNDIIFGDALLTDSLAAAEGLAVIEGASAQVFLDLEAGLGATADWGREDTLTYIQENHVSLAAESNGTNARTGGDDTIDAGAGDDIVYGQEGDDAITGGAGDDSLSGGSGADTFIWTADESGNDTVTDFSQSEGDVLDIADLLIGESSPTAAELDGTYLSIASGTDTLVTIFGDGGNPDQVIELNGFDTTGMSSVQIIDSLLTGGNLVTD